jgi:hypothetical protein
MLNCCCWMSSFSIRYRKTIKLLLIIFIVCLPQLSFLTSTAYFWFEFLTTFGAANFLSMFCRQSLLFTGTLCHKLRNWYYVLNARLFFEWDIFLFQLMVMLSVVMFILHHCSTALCWRHWPFSTTSYEKAKQLRPKCSVSVAQLMPLQLSSGIVKSFRWFQLTVSFNCLKVASVFYRYTTALLCASFRSVSAVF